MNEKLAALLESVQRTAVQAGDVAADVAFGMGKKARELLSDPSLRFGEIGELVGYADTAHFARTFKKLEGMSANEYRNGLKR